MSEDRLRFREHRVPLEEIDDTVEAVIELYDGRVTARAADRIDFLLGADEDRTGIQCSIWWRPDPDGAAGEGIVAFESGPELSPPKGRRTLLLLVGSVAGVLAIMWPWFPQLGPLLIVAGVVAIATFLMTLRMTPGGVAGDMLRRIARTQRME